MRNKKSANYKSIIKMLMVCLMLVSFSLNADTPDLGLTPPIPGEGTDVNDAGGDSVPLDGGLTILILGAAALAIKKCYSYKSE